MWILRIATAVVAHSRRFIDASDCFLARAARPGHSGLSCPPLPKSPIDINVIVLVLPLA